MLRRASEERGAETGGLLEEAGQALVILAR
jgi:hypothetical protein